MLLCGNRLPKAVAVGIREMMAGGWSVAFGRGDVLAGQRTSVGLLGGGVRFEHICWQDPRFGGRVEQVPH